MFGAFRRHMWPILAHTTLDALRVLDWATASLGVEGAVRVGGLDRRVDRVAAVVATPDWLRPGMHDAFDPGKLLDPGQPDAYARYFYDQLNPLTHQERYAHGARILFLCGEKDAHVPADGALRFQAALGRADPEAADRVLVEMIPGLAHLDVREPSRWWPICRRWLAADVD